MDAIRLEDVTKTYYRGEIEIPVLRGVSLAIERGEMVALMGASGSGKSTLLNLLGCLDQSSSGRYWLDGVDVSALNRDQLALIRNQKIGFCFQNFNLLPRTSALQNVLMPLSYSYGRLDELASRERAEHLLERVGLKERMDHEPSQLSGGQQQRVAIARALIAQPPVLLADEPTGALDSKTSAEILALFGQLHREEGLTIILVTHEGEVAEHAQRTIHMRDGKIEHDTPTAQLAGAIATRIEG
ncbi:MAG: ABC transporter ATP-binding protein [Pirellulales bacterium]